MSFVRNHYLPKWVHRLCNASLVALLMALPLVYVLPLLFALIADAALFVAVLSIDPNRFTLVEGIAGDDGYADLDERP